MIYLKDRWLGKARECFICKEKGFEVKIARRIFSLLRLGVLDYCCI